MKKTSQTTNEFIQIMPSQKILFFSSYKCIQILVLQITSTIKETFDVQYRRTTALKTGGGDSIEPIINHRRKPYIYHNNKHFLLSNRFIQIDEQISSREENLLHTYTENEEESRENIQRT